ncbi:hypothetical protein [Novosphingobium rosa]|uniref:hypothetical protein n=1 Tax=Novosphingobium rosa TaxID=76978 RepID=UPI001471ABDE|nr:hypothetical protein [Novosphingobium rosa]
MAGDDTDHGFLNDVLAIIGRAEAPLHEGQQGAFVMDDIGRRVIGQDGNSWAGQAREGME